MIRKYKIKKLVASSSTSNVAFLMKYFLSKIASSVNAKSYHQKSSVLLKNKYNLDVDIETSILF